MELEKTDQEQVEELQKWWHENRLAVILGLVIGIGGLVGWEQWQKSSVNRDMAASAAYDTVQAAVASGDSAAADEALAQLQESFAGSAYLVDALSQRAALAAEKGDWEGAVQNLTAALDSGPDKAMADLLRLRLARAQWAAGASDSALQTLDTEFADSYTALALELRGDIELDRGDEEAARQAWQRALPALTGTPAAQVISNKLSRLGEKS